MIGLLFVFIILVVVLALEQRGREHDVAADRARFLGAGDPRGSVTKAIGDGIRYALPGTRVDSESGVVSLPDDVLFDLGSAVLSSRGKEALVEAVRRLSDVLPCYVSNQRAGLACPGNRYGHEIETIFIEGHTDNVPMLKAGGYDNTNLSLDRARAVQRALVQGSPLEKYENKLRQPLFSFSAYGDTRPLKGILPSDARNRRVDLRIVLTYRPIEELIPGLANGEANANK